MFSPDQWLASTGVSFYNDVATQSLRFDDGSDMRLTRSPSSATNQKNTLSVVGLNEAILVLILQLFLVQEIVILVLDLNN